MRLKGQKDHSHSREDLVTAVGQSRDEQWPDRSRSPKQNPPGNRTHTTLLVLVRLIPGLQGRGGLKTCYHVPETKSKRAVTRQRFSTSSYLHFPQFLTEERATEHIVRQQILDRLKQARQPLLESPQK